MPRIKAFSFSNASTAPSAQWIVICHAGIFPAPRGRLLSMPKPGVVQRKKHQLKARVCALIHAAILSTTKPSEPHNKPRGLSLFSEPILRRKLLFLKEILLRFFPKDSLIRYNWKLFRTLSLQTAAGMADPTGSTASAFFMFTWSAWTTSFKFSWL